MFDPASKLLPSREDLARLLAGAHHDPHCLLGAHPRGADTVLRTRQPGASEVTAVVGGGRYPLSDTGDGLFVGLVPGAVADHRFEVYRDGATTVVDDPYRWPPTLGELDLHLIGEGRHERLWDVLGAHHRTMSGPNGEVTGVSFAVWAPNAVGVRVAGDFDGWDGRGAAMRSLGSSGVWEVFLPGVAVASRYKFRVLGRDGSWHERSDPMARATECPPANASVVSTSEHVWRDGAWLAARADVDWNAAPVSVFEVHLGSWRPGLSYRQAAHELGAYVLELGFTHVELLPLTEHPFGGSWGYQVTSYFAPTARFGSPDDFRYLVDHLHSLGVGVILDWVPGHFPRDAWALGRFDGTALYEHADPRRGEQPDWGTYVFNVGRNEVRNFLLASALYWLTELHVDGLRVDAVAAMLYLDYSRPDGEWVPNDHGGRENWDAVAFLRELNTVIGRSCPGAMVIAEESTAWPGVTAQQGLGFDFKWNMGWMHDTLDYLRRDPIERAAHHDDITFSLEYAWRERYLLPLSHDEVVHGKGSLWQRMPGDDRQRAAGIRALLAYMWAHPGKQLLFMGGEFGQRWEWDADGTLGWWLVAEPLHAGVQRLITDLNACYRATPALYSQDCVPAGFSWLRADDREHNVLAFLRNGADGASVACIVNFAGVAHHHYRLGLPAAGSWHEVLNTDLPRYGGSGVTNGPVLTADAGPAHGWPASTVLSLPPSSMLWLAPNDPPPNCGRTGGPKSATVKARPGAACDRTMDAIRPSTPSTPESQEDQAELAS
jgi:1,4-alpha-glucan branching enzyme